MASNNGAMSKFRYRLKLIIINRYKKIKGIKNLKEDKRKELKKDDNNQFVRERIEYIRKKIRDENNVINNDVVRKKKVGVDIHDRDISKISLNRDISDKNIKSNKKINDVKVDTDNNDVYIKNVVDNIRKKKTPKKKRVGISKFKEGVNSFNKLNNKNKVTKDKKVELELKKDDKELLKEELKVKIIKKIKGKLQNNINEIEVLESELYFLTKDNDKELVLEKVQEIRKKIDEINKKIEKIKREYDILKENYYLDDVVYLDDRFLLDDIIDYKYLVDNMGEYKELVDDYKLLNEYRDIVFKIDEVNSMKESLAKDNEIKIVDYTERDEKYKEICDDVVKIDDIGNGVRREIESQNEYMNKIMSKIGDIDRYEYTQYVFKGVGSLIGNSLKYLGLLLVSPLAGLLPMIAISTVATRNMIKNIRSNMSYEEVKKVSYMAIDFSSDLNRKINDIDYVYCVIDDTLEEIARLKKDFLVQYNSNIDGYSDTLKKINNIEKMIVNNRAKVDIIKKRMIQGKKINDDKMVKVKKLNEEQR